MRNYVKVLGSGVLQIMSKMGISLGFVDGQPASRPLVVSCRIMMRVCHLDTAFGRLALDYVTRSRGWCRIKVPTLLIDANRIESGQFWWRP